jgi:hypothetical protein
MLHARLLWKEANYGVLAKIAKKAGRSKPYVSHIFRGARTDKAVEALLAEFGAPGFASDEVAA